MSHAKVLRSRPVYAGKQIELRENVIKLRTGATVVQEMLHTPEVALVVPLNSAAEVVMVRQFQHCIQQAILEFPAGKVETDESAINCARRELTEETGYIAENLEPLATVYAAPEFSDETVHIFLGRDLAPSSPNPEPYECIEVVRVSSAKLRMMIREAQLVDAKSILATYLLFEHLGEIGQPAGEGQQ